jgi:CRP-like cAMP-binding protein
MSAALRETYLFSVLDDQQLARVEGMSRRVHLEEGEQLFRIGDEAKNFFLVLEGQVKLFRISLSGNEKVIELIKQGNTFAEALMFMERPAYPVNCSALVPTELLAIDSQGFLNLLRESMDTCFRVMGDMSMRLRHLIKEIDDLTLQTATGRVAGYLWGQFEIKGRKKLEFDLDAPKGVLASRLSVKPETFSRILHSFMDEGLVKIKGGHVVILDPDGLFAHAESAGICGVGLGLNC